MFFFLQENVAATATYIQTPALENVNKSFSAELGQIFFPFALLTF